MSLPPNSCRPLRLAPSVAVLPGRLVILAPGNSQCSGLGLLKAKGFRFSPLQRAARSLDMPRSVTEVVNRFLADSWR
jgi:hypothetical protein